MEIFAKNYLGETITIDYYVDGSFNDDNELIEAGKQSFISDEFMQGYEYLGFGDVIGVHGIGLAYMI